MVAELVPLNGPRERTLWYIGGNVEATLGLMEMTSGNSSAMNLPHHPSIVDRAPLIASHVAGYASIA